METIIDVQEWIDHGYRRHEVSENSRVINKLADFILQKRFDDEVGKKYFITVYCYDRSKYPTHAREHVKDLPRYGYMPTMHLALGDSRPFFTIEMNGIASIDEVESYMEKFWDFLNQPYYEKFDE